MNVKTTNDKSSACFAVVRVIGFLVGLFLVNQAGCHSAAPADMTNNRSSSHAEYHWNCGLNVGYVTLRLFHKDVNIYKLADEIKAGVYLEQSVSLLDLKKTFEKYGLTAEGFKADHPEEIVEFAQSGIILIVRIGPVDGGQNAGHFIMIKAGRDHLIAIDPPYHPKKFTKKNILEDSILARTSGEFLVVY